MAGINSLLGLSWFTKIQNLITGFFAIIPQFIYFIYTSCASFLDFLQYLIRKLAGLDVYYVNGEATSGDIIVSFVKGILGIEKSETYSAMSTVFWALVIFGCILLILSTIFSIIKAHYNYDSKKSHPITIVLNSLKTFSLMAIVPIVAIFGLYLSNILLKTLDEITSSSSYIEGVFSDYQVTIETDKGEEKETIKILNEAFKPGIVNTKGDEDDENQSNAQKVYGSYDFFGTVAYTNSQTFSGVLFKTVAYNCNRVRSGEYTTPTSREFEKWDNFGIFFSNKDASLATEDVANQIDFAFSNALTLQDDYIQTIGIYEAIKNKDLDWKNENDDSSLISSYLYGYGAVTGLGLINVKNFSKFNVGLVYYFYNLWGFNFLLGFAGIIAFLILLGNIVFGLITRLLQLLALFFVFPPLIGIAPLDDAKAFKEWRKQFISDVVMAFGAIVGMNIFFLILPFLNTISFFNEAILDRIMNLIIMLAGLVVVKKLIKMISSFTGGSDANAVGEETAKGVGEIGAKALNAGMKAGGVGVKMGAGAGKFYGAMMSPVARPLKSLGSKISKATSRKSRDEKFYNRHVAHDATGNLNDYKQRYGEEEGLRKYEEHYRSVNDKMDSRLSRRESRESVAKNVSKGLKMALVFTSVPFGGSVERGEDGKIDADKSLKATGKGILDIAGATLKLGPGEILRGSSMYKKLEEKGVTDSFKTFFKDTLNSVGIKDFDNDLKTAKEKDKEEKKNVATERQQISETAQNTKRMLEAIMDLKNKL